MSGPRRTQGGRPDDSRYRPPQLLGDVLAQVMARRGYNRVISAQDYSQAWQQVAGALAEVSRAGLLQGGVLQIVVNNSTAVQELTFQKRQLLHALRERLPDQKIRDLKFVVGTIH